MSDRAYRAPKTPQYCCTTSHKTLLGCPLALHYCLPKRIARRHAALRGRGRIVVTCASLQEPDFEKEEWLKQRRKWVYEYQQWHNHRSPWRHLRYAYSIFSSAVLRSIWKPVLLMACAMMAVSAYDTARMAGLLPAWCPCVLSSAHIPFQLSSPALSLLLVFRTNAAYARYADARAKFGGLTRRCRDIMRQALAWWAPEDWHLLRQLVRLNAALPRVLLWTCRHGRDLRKDLQKQGVLLPHELDLVCRAEHPITTLMTMMTMTIQAAHVAPFQRLVMDRNITHLMDCMGDCEMIYNTPIPRAYTRHTCRFLCLWLLLVPLVFWTSCGWVGFPAAVAVAFTFLGIEEIAVQIEEPFYTLPLETIATNVPRDIFGIATTEGEVQQLVNATTGTVQSHVAWEAAVAAAPAVSGGLVAQRVPSRRFPSAGPERNYVWQASNIPGIRSSTGAGGSAGAGSNSGADSSATVGSSRGTSQSIAGTIVGMSNGSSNGNSMPMQGTCSNSSSESSAWQRRMRDLERPWGPTMVPYSNLHPIPMPLQPPAPAVRQQPWVQVATEPNWQGATNAEQHSDFSQGSASRAATAGVSGSGPAARPVDPPHRVPPGAQRPHAAGHLNSDAACSKEKQLEQAGASGSSMHVWSKGAANWAQQPSGGRVEQTTGQQQQQQNMQWPHMAVQPVNEAPAQHPLSAQVEQGLGGWADQRTVLRPQQIRRQVQAGRVSSKERNSLLDPDYNSTGMQTLASGNLLHETLSAQPSSNSADAPAAAALAGNAAGVIADSSQPDSAGQLGRSAADLEWARPFATAAVTRPDGWQHAGEYGVATPPGWGAGTQPGAGGNHASGRLADSIQEVAGDRGQQPRQGMYAEGPLANGTDAFFSTGSEQQDTDERPSTSNGAQRPGRLSQAEPGAPSALQGPMIGADVRASVHTATRIVSSRRRPAMHLAADWWRQQQGALLGERVSGQGSDTPVAVQGGSKAGLREQTAGRPLNASYTGQRGSMADSDQ